MGNNQTFYKTQKYFLKFIQSHTNELWNFCVGCSMYFIEISSGRKPQWLLSMTSRLADWDTLLGSIDMMKLSGRERGRTRKGKKNKTSNCDCPTET
jgi:hypothetical protein